MGFASTTYLFKILMKYLSFFRAENESWNVLPIEKVLNFSRICTSLEKRNSELEPNYYFNAWRLCCVPIRIRIHFVTRIQFTFDKQIRTKTITKQKLWAGEQFLHYRYRTDGTVLTIFDDYKSRSGVRNSICFIILI